MCNVFQGDRFGGALDGAAKQFSEAYDSGFIPMDFVNDMRKKGKLIMGIGHRVKSVSTGKRRNLQYSQHIHCLYTTLMFFMLL